jgi:hypothetical protein
VLVWSDLGQYWRRRIKHVIFYLKFLKGRDHLGSLGVDGGIILK